MQVLHKVNVRASAALLVFCCLCSAALAADATRPGELIVEPPTLICLGFEWRISGDENVDATCRVAYRRQGAAEWREYLPLCRMGKGREANYGFGNFGDPNHRMRYRIPDALGGSIMDLEPGTTYEVRLEIRDPDGVDGEPVRHLTLSTRPEPEPAEGGEVRHVYPPGYEGEKQEPAYRSIMHAVNGFHPWCDCYQTVHPNAAPPGTVVKLHAGTYKIDRRNYREPTQRWLHGTITLVADGTPEKPIAIVGAGDGEVVIDGDGCHNLLNVRAADYLHFEGLTIRNTFIAFHGGFQGEAACRGLTVRNCWLENIQYGVLAQDGASEGFTITDNVIIGANPHDRFNPESGGAWGRTWGGYAVNLAGSGHVVAHNYVADFWDGLNVFTNSLADPALGQQSRAIDFYNNDMHNSTDNFIETDGGYANIRVLRNRCFNVMGAPLSVQPVYAGPVYWIRNVVYNAHKGAQAFKMSNGDNVLIYHNTSTCHYTVAGGMDYGDVRNNLFMGPGVYLRERDRERGRRVLAIGFGSPRTILDYNAHRVGLPGTDTFFVNAPGSDYMADSLDELAARSPYAAHSVAVQDYGVFADAEEPEHALSNEGPLYHPHQVDLRPAPGAPITDAGCVLPGISDDYLGEAPDIGAYEAGRPVPTYGPREGPYLERLEALREGRYRTTATLGRGD